VIYSSLKSSQLALQASVSGRWEELDYRSYSDDVLEAIANDNRVVLDHDHLLFNNSAHEVDPCSFFERFAADVHIKQQSRQVAHKLSESDYDPYLKSDRKVSLIGLLSGAVLPISTYRNINFIPEVAQRNRQPLVAEFQLFLKENPKYRRYSRYLVVSSGRHFSMEDFPDRLQAFNESIRRFLGKCERRDIECLFVGIEFTLNEAKMVNLHANVITSPNRAFGPTGWATWLNTIRAHFGVSQVEDAGRLKDGKEVIKYVCKYADIAALSGQETKFLAEVFHKRQLIRPLGAFLRWRRSLKDAGQKVRFDHRSNELVRCQVSKRRRPEAVEEWTEEEIRSDIEDTNMHRDRPKRSSGNGPDEPIENQILCRTLPQTRVGTFAEPFAVVVNYTGDPITRNGREGLEAIESHRRHHFKMLAENGVEAPDLAAAGRSRLDTLTITSRAMSVSYFLISRKRRERLRSILGLTNDPTPEQVGSAVFEFMDHHLTKERLEWSPDVADEAELLREGLEQQNVFWSKVDACREAEREYETYRALRKSFLSVASSGLLDFDAEDFAIPY
jgi:hypothetical protein